MISVENMTEITKNMHTKAMELESVEQAAELLARTGQFRSLGDILSRAAGEDKPKKKLVDALCNAEPEANRDSVDKKVRNWLSGRTQTVSRQDAWHLAAVLGLDLEETDLFLRQVTGEGIHWREPSEIAQSYAIAQGLSREETQRLLSRAAQTGEKCREPEPQTYTVQVECQVRPLLSGPEDELISFLEENRLQLGAFHNTAYRLFREYLEILEGGQADDHMGEEPRVTARYILEHYLHRNLVPIAKREDAGSRNAFGAIQRSIRANWPDEQTLSKMKRREQDVSRKVMIMLFLAVDGGEPEPAEDDWDYEADFDDWEEELTRDERFRAVKTRLDTMLRACGFQTLDPRSPFDWVVLFALCAEDLWDVDQRLRQTLAALFPDGNGKQ